MPARCADAPLLRAALRAATHEHHQQLDNLLGRLDLAERHDYACFLEVQLSARLGVEQWLYLNAPAHWLPPSQVSLLRRDLDWLGYDARSTRGPDFIAPVDSPEAWIGAAWVLAGSSLGNRMMEREVADRAADNWPMAFLQDQAMPRYFKALLPLLQDTATNVAAEKTARAVFAHFHAEAGQRLLAVAA